MSVKGKQNRKRRTKRENPFGIWATTLLQAWQRIQWRRLITICTVGAISALVYVTTLWLMNRPIRAVVIDGAFARVSAIQVEDVLSPHVQAGFLSADLEAMRGQLKSLPWVANATLRRRWPGTIEVRIEEQSPAARWKDSGLLNVDGALFVDNVTHAPAELPLLSGPRGSERRVAAMYFRIEERLERRGMAATSLRLDDRGAWELLLSSGIRVRLGARMLESRLDRFFEALDKVVAARAEDVDYIDMRYTNGFAIGWKSQASMNAKAGDGDDAHV